MTADDVYPRAEIRELRSQIARIEKELENLGELVSAQAELLERNMLSEKTVLAMITKLRVRAAMLWVKAETRNDTQALVELRHIRNLLTVFKWVLQELS